MICMLRLSKILSMMQASVVDFPRTQPVGLPESSLFTAARDVIPVVYSIQQDRVVQSGQRAELLPAVSLQIDIAAKPPDI